MTKDDAQFASFCKSYARGIIHFLHSGEPQTVFFDDQTGHFGTEELEPGVSPTDVAVWISDDWKSLVDPTNAPSDPAARGFNSDALEQELEARLTTSPRAKWYFEQALNPNFNG